MKRSPRSSRSFFRNDRAIAAVEFAMTLPIMLFLFVGAAQVGQAVAISRKVTITTRIVTDLVTQYSNVSCTTLTTILDSSSQVITPYSANNLSMSVSEISTASGRATLVWTATESAGGSATCTQPNSTFTLPSQLTNSGSTAVYYIYGQVTYAFTPAVGYQIIGTTNINDHIYMSPRLTNSIAYTGP
ncbi:MAG TPA: TadE/TadG family type IV pilus assembly protein [Methylovirgula sp.]|nr:TadE/TadG family type IV pilus assembly protein [Methylovirgula sp.]